MKWIQITIVVTMYIRHLVFIGLNKYRFLHIKYSYWKKYTKMSSFFYGLNWETTFVYSVLLILFEKKIL